MKGDVLALTRNELNDLPLRKVEHFIGFTRGHKEREKEEMERQQRRNQARR